MLYLLVQVNESIKRIVPEHVVSIEFTNNQFSDLFGAVTSGEYGDREVEVFIRREKSESWKKVDNGLKGNLEMLEVLKYSQVKFCLIEKTHLDTPQITNTLNAFDILMNNSYQTLLPQHCTEYNDCNKLYNEIIDLFRNQNVGWTGGVHDTIGKAFVNRIMNAIWYIDPHLSTLHARSCNLPVFFTQLKTYQDGETYNKFYHTSHHKKNPLSQQKLVYLSSSLELSVSQPWANNDVWNQVIPATLSLIEILKKYAGYLTITTTNMNILHHSDGSARNPENDCTMYRIIACKNENLNDIYSQLNYVLLEKQMYEYIDIKQYLPIDIMKRYQFIKELQLTFPIGVYRYHQGNYLGTINYVWRVPENEDELNETLKARMLPYKKRKFGICPEKYGKCPEIFHVYKRQILYMPLALSVRDLREIVTERLKIIYSDPLPFTIHIPSDEWIRLQFCPTNATTTRSMHHTGQFNVKFKVQGRLLRKSSDDAHYCAALFRYLREFCIHYKQWTCLISADDKHKVPIGEDVAVSTGVRNRHSMVAQNSTLAAADHDFTKLSITPSVTFFISIPNEISGSFYDGQVFVSYKDATFEPSNAIRHSTEFLNALNIQYAHQMTPPILCLYTDGGPDHRCNYGSVQISLICLFLSGNFDLLIAVRTAPNHSWTNPAERIMSILNLGLQGVALKRDQMSPESEVLFDTANTLDDIRTKAQESNKLESELKESIASVQNILNNQTERLSLKEKKFKCNDSANVEAITELFESIHTLDPTLTVEETTQVQIRHHTALIEFIDTHCRIRAYSFQVKKCNNITCSYCKPIRLPLHEFNNLNFLPDPIPSRDNTDHYMPFERVYGTETTEEYRQTYMQKQANAEPISKSILIGGKIRFYINCEDCRKRRCVYSDKSLNNEEQEDYQQAIESYSYSCGAPIFPDDHYLSEVVFVSTRISCDSPIEILYYSSRKSGNYPICYYCGESESLVAPSQSLKERFKQIYPLCEGCQGNEKEFYTKGKIKTNGSASKRRKT
ncbi:hypothetical protein GLOIN_2v1767477 [Rhizophagus irregularis DAOM 181602=DAOM 197198]|uniref:Uncharacterized protein n=1 Tax=Rhizophagus irregularis (strain DAOM 181602 / DAOM 197198 / MUCL 43194) TaxID=747089 RepID=A0A2P4QJ29_RHIID|nr:hypothetical protein GLOIN_2v1767477 [Rhizophagus irregularis DAOM 181602=DAOM 197198]POG77649.1 hypothetical protein GLOIN_2v1767477 [Rhizophagus irregularis DAOM 181602=DAOM 197198]|eukprot:XP_025184515.1 hypothetical protein GLOIN_2v1767477 [Rhizophagus irregularis DAOM 181602=DAOM 197198]